MVGVGGEVNWGGNDIVQNILMGVGGGVSKEFITVEVTKPY